MAEKGKKGGKRPRTKKNNQKKDHTRTALVSLSCVLAFLLVAVILFYTKYPVKDKVYPPAKPSGVSPETLPPEPDTKKEKPREVIPTDIKTRKTYKVAIVIDDLGYNNGRSEELLTIDASLTFSIFPFCPYSKLIARKAHARGRDVLLHLPMEPYNYPEKNPGNGSLFLDMNDEEILRRLDADLSSVPFVKGVNNHMGSKFTENKEKMRVVLRELKERNLFFLDSRTSRNSVGYSMAREIGLKTATRNIFLDNDQDIKSINAQIYKLVRQSIKNGSAIGIGHPYPSTIEALKQTIPELGAKGIEVVPISQLVN